jgi:hypothetical protein
MLLFPRPVSHSSKAPAAVNQFLYVATCAACFFVPVFFLLYFLLIMADRLYFNLCWGGRRNVARQFSTW